MSSIRENIQNNLTRLVWKSPKSQRKKSILEVHFLKEIALEHAQTESSVSHSTMARTTKAELATAAAKTVGTIKSFFDYLNRWPGKQITSTRRSNGTLIDLYPWTELNWPQQMVIVLCGVVCSLNSKMLKPKSLVNNQKICKFCFVTLIEISK